MGRGAGIGTWRPIDSVLVAAVILGGTATILVGVLTHVKEIGPRSKYEARPAKVSGVTSAMTRCDDCINPFLDDDSSSEEERHDGNGMDGSNKHEGQGGRMGSEGDRMSPDGGRMGADGERMSPEGGQMGADGERMSPEGGRMGADGERMSPEGGRMGADGERMSPEGGRMGAAGERMSPEDGRMGADGNRKSPEGGRMGADGERMSPEDGRMGTDGDRKRPEGGRMEAYVGWMDQKGGRMDSRGRDMGPEGGHPECGRMGPDGGRPEGEHMGPDGGRPEGEYMGSDGGRPEGEHMGSDGGKPEGEHIGPDGGKPELGGRMGSDGGKPEGEHMGPDGKRDDKNNPGGGRHKNMCELTMPNWWMPRVPDKQTRQTVEKECPLVPALYVTVTYTDKHGTTITALLHEDLYSAKTFPTHSFSMCHGSDGKRMGSDGKRMGSDGERMGSDGERMGSDGERMGSDGERMGSDGRQKKPEDKYEGPTRKRRQAPGGAAAPPENNPEIEKMKKTREEFMKLFGSGGEFPVYVDSEKPQHVTREAPRCSMWMCKKFIPLIIFTIVMMLILMIRRIVVSKKAQRIHDVQKKPALYAMNGQVVSVDQPTKAELAAADPEKNPAALGPEVMPNPNYDVTILSGKTVMLSGIAGDVTTPEKEAEAFSFRPSTPRSQGQDTLPPVGDEGVMPPVYTDETDPENRPPTYSSIDLSKY